jgi:HEAT repeat protein
VRSRMFFCIFYAAGGIWLLGAQPHTTAWNVLTDAALNAKNPDHRRQAVAALAAIGPAPEAVKVLEDVLKKDPESMIRQTAAAALGEMKATEAIPALQGALEDDSGEVAFSAAKVLWDLGDPAGKLTFEEILTGERKDSPGFLGRKMTQAKRTMRDPKKLAYMGVKEASGVMLGPMSMGITVAHDAMKNKDSGATGRALAVEYMSKDCDARSVQLLEWSLKEDGNWLVQSAAARGLGKCGDAKEVPLLEKYLGDSHEPLKYQAAAAIVRLSLKQTAPAATAASDKPLE